MKTNMNVDKTKDKRQITRYSLRRREGLKRPGYSYPTIWALRDQRGPESLRVKQYPNAALLSLNRSRYKQHYKQVISFLCKHKISSSLFEAVTMSPFISSIIIR